MTFIVIGLISLFFNCTNSLDNILRNRSIVQIALLLAGIIAIFGLLLFLQEYVTGFMYQGKEKINPLNLFAIFSQAINADANNTHGNAYIFQLIVSLIGAVCFGGLLISTISNVFQRRIEASAKGDVRYWRLSGHNIIIGANELLEPSLRNLYFDSGKNRLKQQRKVLVVTTQNAGRVRSRIKQMGIKITVIANEKSAVDEFKMRFPQVESVLPDIEVEFLLQSPHCQDTFKALQEIVDSVERKPYVVICSDNSSDNYLMAGHLPVECYMKQIPVLAQMDYFNEHLVRGMISQGRYRNVNFFGFVNNDLSFVADIRVAQQLVYYHARNKGVETKNFQTLWESYSYDNVRQTRLCYLNGLATLIDQLGVRIAQGSEDSVEFSTDKALSILQRQFMGWNFLAGYRASATMNTESDWTYRRINKMFTYEVLKDENGMDLPNRQRQMLEYLKDFIIWLKENNLYLALKDSMSS